MKALIIIVSTLAFVFGGMVMEHYSVITDPALWAYFGAVWGSIIGLAAGSEQ